MKRYLLWVGIGLVTSGTLYAADTVKLADALAGKVAPLQLKLSDLDSGWYRVNCTGAQSGAGGNAAAVYLGVLMGRGGAGHYTRGETVKVEGENFLVAYRLATKPVDYMAMMRGGGQPPTPEKPTPESTLDLCLLRVSGLESLSDIRVFDLVTELTGGDTSPEALATARAQVAESTGLGNLLAVGEALAAYAQDGDKTLPVMKEAAAVAAALSPYCKTKNAFTSPETKELYQPNPSLSGRKMADVTQPGETVAFYDVKPVNGQRAVLFLNGRAERVSETKWPALKKASQIP
jgi:hypothetical protein